MSDPWYRSFFDATYTELWDAAGAFAGTDEETAGLRSVHGNDGSAAWCTFSDDSRFFSHRRDALILGSTGRMAACAWIG